MTRAEIELRLTDDVLAQAFKYGKPGNRGSYDPDPWSFVRATLADALVIGEQPLADRIADRVAERIANAITEDNLKSASGERRRADDAEANMRAAKQERDEALALAHEIQSAYDALREELGQTVALMMGAEGRARDAEAALAVNRQSKDDTFGPSEHQLLSIEKRDEVDELYPLCSDQSCALTCNRARGHVGPHVAYDFENIPVAWWPKQIERAKGLAADG
jgi:hypothetical protein